MRARLISVFLLAIAAVCWGQDDSIPFGQIMEHYDKMTNTRSVGMVIDITRDRTDGEPTNILWIQFVEAECPDVEGSPYYYMIVFLGAQEWWSIKSVRTLVDGDRRLFKQLDIHKDYSAKGVEEVILFMIDLEFIRRIGVAREVLLRFNGEYVMGTYKLNRINQGFLVKYLLKIEEKSGGV